MTERRLLLGAALAFVIAAAASSLYVWTRPARPALVRVEQVDDGGTRVRYRAGHYPVVALPNGERRTIKSLLRIDRPMRFGDYVWDEAGVPAGPVWVRVDLGLQTLSVFRDGQEIGSTLILYGADSKPTQPGVYPVLERAVEHRSTLYDADMPYMLRLTGDGVAIHASDVQASAATHGCIGVPLDFARLLYAQMRKGDPVVILGPGTTG